MSNLKQRIKKFIVEKAVDIAEILLFFVLLYIVMQQSWNQYVSLSIVVVLLVAFVIASKITSKSFEHWKTPDLDRTEKVKYQLFESGYQFIIVTIAAFIVYSLTRSGLGVVVIGLIFLIAQYNVWKQFRKPEALPEAPTNIVDAVEVLNEQDIPQEEIKEEDKTYPEEFEEKKVE